ncbi:zinc-binding dehydrogenase [Microbacterium sp. ARD32]|nr:zinc-binding dehydrogenase [Microbacterium sp. ARD32]MDT0158762.1 zinc-binding dehydrogenase [Microbacterium sp. ARD32]
MRTTFVGLNPMDWMFSSSPETAAMFGISLPARFATDFAGVIDEIGDDSAGFAVGDRVYGSAIGRAAADHIIIDPAGADVLRRTPQEIDDATASTLAVAGMTASAALDAAGVGAGDTVLIGGAAGGVGIFAGQLARLAGARVIGTASTGTFGFLEELGVEPVAYGPGLAERIRLRAPGGITAAADLFGTEAAEVALALGVAPSRISTVAAGGDAPAGVRTTGAFDADKGALERITDAIVAGELTVPIARIFELSDVREAVALQASRRVHGKITLRM